MQVPNYILQPFFLLFIFHELSFARNNFFCIILNPNEKNRR